MSVAAASAAPARIGPNAQAAVGLGFAALILAGWIAGHLYGVFVHDLTTPLGLALAPVLILAQGWLGVGLFIVAHDAMHGTLAPGRRRLNAFVGELCLRIYAGFGFRRLLAAHMEHHRRPGTAEDPDFDADHPRAFLPWFARFFRRYFGLREFAALTLVFLVERFAFGASQFNAVLFWGVPSILSAVQLFTFGTWFPHREDEAPFPDHHRARSNPYGWFVSLLTCFHFGGYHHEHHLYPGVPWWRLPATRGR